MTAGPIKAFMCKTAFEYDARARHDEHPQHFYTSEEALRAGSPCVAQCGIVEVSISLVCIVQDEDFQTKHTQPEDGRKR